MSDTKDKITPSERRALKRREAAEKADAIFGINKGSAEPTINALNYLTDLMKALNHYNVAFDHKQKRKWTMAYVGKQNQKLYEDLPDYEFKSVGTVIRLKVRDQYLAENELSYIETRLAQLRKLSKMERVSAVKDATEQKPVKPNVVDKTFDAVNHHLTEIKCMIDTFITTGVEPDIATYIKSSDIAPAVVKQIPQEFVNNIAEITEAIEGKDKQLVEGYSCYKKMKLKKLLKIYESISDACMQKVVTAKATVTRKRVVKEKPASIVAKAVKFLPEHAEYGLKSVAPQLMVNSSEIWIFNTKYKKLQVYRASADAKMTIKGTSILNYDVATSKSKTVRKPELVKDYVGMTKRTFATAFAAIKTKEAEVNGRVNAECIILKVL